LISTVIDYSCSRLMETKNNLVRFILLLFSIFTNLGILFVFKYYNFFADSLAVLLESLGLGVDLQILHIILPVGISFYTFQTMSYTIDIYYGKLKPERHFGIFALYVAFFPQLVAGPIERAARLLPQFHMNPQF